MNSPKDQSVNPAPWTPASPPDPNSPSHSPDPYRVPQTHAPGTPPPPTYAQLQQENDALQQGKAAMSQIIWNLVRQLEPEEQQMVVSSVASDELWQLAFVAADAGNTDPSKVRVLAGLMHPIGESEKKRVVRLLRGTDKTMFAALVELGLPHPPGYVQKAIAAHLVWDETANTWRSVKPAGFIERMGNFIGVPKS